MHVFLLHLEAVQKRDLLAAFGRDLDELLLGYRFDYLYVFFH
jgi:hypothetical protein